jgi:hypothetical protein
LQCICMCIMALLYIYIYIQIVPQFKWQLFSQF